MCGLGGRGVVAGEMNTYARTYYFSFYLLIILETVFIFSSHFNTMDYVMQIHDPIPFKAVILPDCSTTKCGKVKRVNSYASHFIFLLTNFSDDLTFIFTHPAREN